MEHSRNATWFALAGKAFAGPSPLDLRNLACLLQDDAPDPGVTRLIEELDRDIAADPLALERDHVRLFLSPLGAFCPPWQSAHVGEQRLMGPPHLGAMEWYRREGVEPAASNEPADHIAMLLTFFAFLLDSGAVEDKLARFIEDHLLWAREFFDAVCTHAQSRFYSLLAFETKYRLERLADSLLTARPIRVLQPVDDRLDRSRRVAF
jgi:TorA maturation chaperone TorD